MVRIFLSVLSSALILVIIGAIAALWVFFHFGQELPDYRQLTNYEPPVVSRLYASDGRMFAEYAVEKRVFVPISSMPKRVVQTFLAAEDKNFYSHPGIDAMGILRASLTNLMNLGQGKTPKGASTITQQVAKNFFLTSERSLVRKIKEAILSFRIEHALSKDRILEIYLNEIYLGQNSYGVSAAALNYFNKTLDELTIEEAAYLAALPKAPNNYHPLRAPEAAKRRRNYVIDRMLELDLITAREASVAKEMPITLSSPHEADMIQADFFSEEVRRSIFNQFGKEALYKGGLVIKTTLDPHYQKNADDALRKGILDYDTRHGWRGPIARFTPVPSREEWLEKLKTVQKPAGLGIWTLAVVIKCADEKALLLTADNKEETLALEKLKWARPCLSGQYLGPEVKRTTDVLQVGDVVPLERTKEGVELRQIPNVSGAIVVMDPNTGRVLAMSGGYSYEISEFNRATQAIRQPGSAFKPFVYLAAFERGKTPASIVMDTPVTFDLGPSLPPWSPQNISKRFYGPVTLRTALENSYNVSTIRVAQAAGIRHVADVAQRLGVMDSMAPQLSMALGAGETTPLKMAIAYSTFVNGGKQVMPSLIDRVQDRNGSTVYRHDMLECPLCQNQQWSEGLEMPALPDERKALVDPIHAYQVLSVLEGVIKRGTGKRLKPLNVPLAGKTGSTNDFRDAWFVGLTPTLVVSVYLGFDNHQSLGKGEVGGRAALSIFEDFAKRALLKDSPRPFRVPSGTKLIRVNLQTGKPTTGRDPQAIWEAFSPTFNPSSSKEGEENVGKDLSTKVENGIDSEGVY